MCNREAASVEELSNTWRGKVQFVGVASNGSVADFRGFVDKYSLTFPQIDDAEGALFGAYNIPATPGLVVVDTDGTMQGRIGAADPADVEQLLVDATR